MESEAVRPNVDSNERKQVSETIAEYLLFGAVILMTGCGAVYYKTINENAQLSSLSVYLGLVYFGFLAWAFAQLNFIHRKRRIEREEDLRRMDLRPPEAPEEGELTQASVIPSAPVSNLTLVQLAIVVGVFLTAFVTLTWALSVYRRL